MNDVNRDSSEVVYQIKYIVQCIINWWNQRSAEAGWQVIMEQQIARSLSALSSRAPLNQLYCTSIRWISHSWHSFVLQISGLSPPPHNRNNKNSLIFKLRCHRIVTQIWLDTYCMIQRCLLATKLNVKLIVRVKHNAQSTNCALRVNISSAKNVTSEIRLDGRFRTCVNYEQVNIADRSWDIRCASVNRVKRRSQQSTRSGL